MSIKRAFVLLGTPFAVLAAIAGIAFLGGYRPWHKERPEELDQIAEKGKDDERP